MTAKREFSKSEGLALSVGTANGGDEFEEDGLGERYLKKMGERKDQLHQVRLFMDKQHRIYVNDTGERLDWFCGN